MNNNKTHSNTSIDLIDFKNMNEKQLAHFFDGDTNLIKANALLIVPENQQVVFFNKNKITDILDSGEHVLNMRTLPILSAIQGWKYGFNDSFQADIVFVETQEHSALKWETKMPIGVEREDKAILEIRANGTFSFRIVDSGLFAEYFCGDTPITEASEIENKLVEIVSSKFEETAEAIQITVEDVFKKLDIFSEALSVTIRQNFIEAGIDISNFVIDNISIHQDSLESIIESAGNVNLEEIAKIKAERDGVSYENEDEVIEIPPIPQVKYYVAINNKQAGPFNSGELETLCKEGALTKKSLIWKKGLSNWERAENQTELEYLWTI